MQTWEELEQLCRQCTRCPLHEGRTNTVFGVGNHHASILFVGEAPGEQEDLKGEPFVGRAGMLLDDFLTAVDLKREDVYIANILKCRPPKNRDPLPEEEACCIGYLRAQCALIRPKIIVALGRIAAMQIIRPDFRITQEHGQWFEKNGVLCTAVFHPAALLRDPRKKPDTLRDFKNIAAKAKELSL